MLILRWDADCCVWPHFISKNGALFRNHINNPNHAMQTSSSLVTHLLMINPTSNNHSVCIFTMVRGDSSTWRICSGWCRATLKSITRVMCVFVLPTANTTSHFSDRFAIEIERLLRVSLQWITVVQPISQVADVPSYLLSTWPDLLWCLCYKCISAQFPLPQLLSIDSPAYWS